MKKNDGKTKIRVISAMLKLPNSSEFDRFIAKLYQENMMSGLEISEYIIQNTGIELNPRSIQRRLAKYGITRDMKQSFNNAIKRGRVKWRYKDKKIKRVYMNKELRYKALERDNFRCVKCGADPTVAILEVDHILALCKGGLTVLENLQTLCFACNQGKRLAKNER